MAIQTIESGSLADSSVINGNFQDLQNQITSLSSQVLSASSNNSTNASSISDINSAISSLTTRVATAESNITTLSTATGAGTSSPSSSTSTFTQPNMASNGTMGGSNFAVASNIDDGVNKVYNAFNNNNNTYYASGAEFHDACYAPTGLEYSVTSYRTANIYFYNPNPLKIVRLTITNSTKYAPKVCFLLGSDDGIYWHEIANYTNTVSSKYGEWHFDVNSKYFHKYHCLQICTSYATSSAYVWVANIEIDAQVKTIS